MFGFCTLLIFWVLLIFVFFLNEKLTVELKVQSRNRIQIEGQGTRESESLREREKERWGERGGGGVVDGVNLTATPPTRPGRSPVTGHRVTPVTGAMMTMVHRLPVTVEIKIKSKSKQGHNTNKQEENQL